MIVFGKKIENIELYTTKSSKLKVEMKVFILKRSSQCRLIKCIAQRDSRTRINFLLFIIIEKPYIDYQSDLIANSDWSQTLEDPCVSYCVVL